jgi:hypothetical protein
LSTNRIITEVEEALATPKVLDRDLIRDLVNLAKALEKGLDDTCRSNLELSGNDQKVVLATNQLKEACDALLSAYNQKVEVDDSQVIKLVEDQITSAQDKLKE